MLVGWLVVFNVPSTARSFRDGTPILLGQYLELVTYFPNLSITWPYSLFFGDCLYTHHVNGATQIVKAEPRFSMEPTSPLNSVYTDHPG